MIKLLVNITLLISVVGFACVTTEGAYYPDSNYQDTYTPPPTENSGSTGTPTNGNSINAIQTQPTTNYPQVNLGTPVTSEFMELCALFETSIYWEAQDDSWRNRRESWLQEMNAASTLGQVITLFLEMERSIKFEAQTPEWRNRRDSWISDITACQSVRCVAALMVELESSVFYNAQDPQWAGIRDEWLRRMKKYL